MVIQEPVLLVLRMRRRSSASRSFTSPLSLAPLASSHIFIPSCHSSLSSRRWFAVEILLAPVTDPISLLFARSKLRYFLLSGVTRYCRPRPDFLTKIVLKVPTMGGRDFGFQKKIQGTKVLWRSFSTPANTCPVSFGVLWKISIPIVLHKLPRRNSPWDISPPFWWSHKNISPTSTFDILANHVCICHPH